MHTPTPSSHPQTTSQTLPSEPASDQGIDLVIATVNYRTPQLTLNCLASLEPELAGERKTQVVVVDNKSEDGSVETLAAAIAAHQWDSWVTLLPQSKNGGYAYGNNVAITRALQSPTPPRYVLLLNPDTQVRPGAIQTLIDFMDQHPQVGLAGSGLENLDGKQRRRAFRFPSIWSELDQGMRLGLLSRLLAPWVTVQPMPATPCRAQWVPGASLIVRREVFESIGLLDEAYFLYFEETDFCLKAARAGWECWYVPQSRVVHHSGQSTGVTGPGSLKRRPAYWFESRRRYFIQNHGKLYAMMADLAWITGFLTWKPRQILLRKPNPDPPYFFWDFLRHSTLRRGFSLTNDVKDS